MKKTSIFLIALCAYNVALANHYGMAGCGLGSLVFKDEPGPIQIVAATLNNLVSPQTSAITSGTSGCYEPRGEDVQINYIESNKYTLKEDAARGVGETLSGLSLVLGCQDSQGFNTEIKSNYNSIFKSENPKEILNAIKSNSNLKKACAIQG